jgi:hypothetical protein
LTLACLCLGVEVVEGDALTDVCLKLFNQRFCSKNCGELFRGTSLSRDKGLGACPPHEKLLWIDLVDVMEASSTLKQVDAEILTRSTLSFSRTFVLDP